MSTGALNVQTPEGHCAARAPPREMRAPQTQGPDLEDSDQAPRRNRRLREQRPSGGECSARRVTENGGCVLSEDSPPHWSRCNGGEHSEGRRRGRGPAVRRPEAGAPLWPAAAARLRSATRGPGRPPHPARSPSPAVWSARSLARRPTRRRSPAGDAGAGTGEERSAAVPRPFVTPRANRSPPLTSRLPGRRSFLFVRRWRRLGVARMLILYY